jgi:hypothetical protein
LGNGRLACLNGPIYTRGGHFLTALSLVKMLGYALCEYSINFPDE